MFENVFRFNRLFTLTPFVDLTDEQRKNLEHLTANRDFFGILHAPSQARLAVKGINRDLADFLLQFTEPMKLSDAFRRFDKGTRQEKEQFIIRLVLESVLEVQAGDEFISGVEAVDRILLHNESVGREGSDPVERNYIQRISDKYIHSAFNSALTLPRDISIYLYNFNRIPLSRRWQQRFPGEKELAQFLDLHVDGSWAGMPDSILTRSIKIDENGQPDIFDSYWRSWNFKDKRHSEELPSYKVYFSPLPNALPTVFRIVRDAAGGTDAHFMKIGRHLSGILRPDKLIVYFSEYASARDFARETAAVLGSYDSQGTPFSFQVDPENPLVSLGVDPPRRFTEAYSWRLYITNKLALAINGARRSSARNPLDYIHSYMRLIDVDSLNWCPLRDDWSMEFRPIEQENG
jgi:hypothetical protein